MEVIMPTARLREFLDRSSVRYLVIAHSPAYTAQEIAASAHIPGKELVKTVMLRIDGKMAMAVLPASEQVSLDKLRSALSAESVEISTEEEFKYLFPECEIGAMPPFGNLYNMPVYASPTLTKDEEITFNSGTHRELVKLTYHDYENLVKPMVVELSNRK
jgi:Ala-tRNA(Pro) deacylase